MQIEGKTIIITGGASGLGAETMRYLHGKGANVVACDMNAEAGDALALLDHLVKFFVAANVEVMESSEELLQVAYGGIPKDLGFSVAFARKTLGKMTN